QTVNLDSLGGYLNYVVGVFMVALGVWTAVHVRKKYQRQVKEGTLEQTQSVEDATGSGEREAEAVRADSSRGERSHSDRSSRVELTPLSQRVAVTSRSSREKERTLEETPRSPSSSFQLVIAPEQEATASAAEASNTALSPRSEAGKPSRLQAIRLKLCRNVSFDNPTTQKVGITALLVGIVHGFAGPGGILGVLPAVVLNNWGKSVAYLGSFCVSSIFIMGVFAALYGEVTGRLGGNSLLMEFRIGICSASFSFIVGLAWIGLQATGQMSKIFGE
ncbi:hypothetical protein BBJ28_00018081, partial [Nothophytophthora sp. Chile5]